jgi:ubiquinone/menaquinone biosynthesis C-methylase UbiE
VRPQDVVAAGYDAIAARYDAWQSEIADDPRGRWVGRLLALVPERPQILEIGCGAGIEPTPTFATVGQLTGVDISHAQLERARQAVPGANLIHGDVTSVAFPLRSFDAVVALYVLTHIPTNELPRLLTRIATWLKPEGLLLATFSSRAEHDDLVDDFLGAPMFFAGFDQATNERLVEAAGLELIESRLEQMDEPESEPGRGPQRVSFHWVLARKGAD